MQDKWREIIASSCSLHCIFQTLTIAQQESSLCIQVNIFLANNHSNPLTIRAITRRFSVQHCIPLGAQFHIATARNHLATNQGMNHSSLATCRYQRATNRFLGMCDYCLTSSGFFLMLPFCAVFICLCVLFSKDYKNILTLQLAHTYYLAKILRCGNDYFVNQCLSVMVQSKYLLKHLQFSSQ